VASAIWFPRARAVELRPEALAETGPNEVRVRAALSAISHGTEMLVYRGEVDADLPLDLPTLAGGYGFPLKYGYASVGYAVSVGRDVLGVHEGDLVFALHPHQDEYLVRETLVRRLPGRVPEQGVFLANLDTAINVVLDAKPRLGDLVVVFGQGVVGLLVTQLLRRSGARVVAVEPSALRRSFAERCGAEAAIAPSDRPLLRAAPMSPSMRAGVRPPFRRPSTASGSRAPWSSARGTARNRCRSTWAARSTAAACAS
jgi:threonine dehydrogenase-like Zn-dependent dehydrogenase